jgi:hypothetical protein
MKSIKDTALYLEESLEQKEPEDNLLLGFYASTDYLPAFINLVCTQQQILPLTIDCSEYFNPYDDFDTIARKKNDFLNLFEKSLLALNTQNNSGVLIFHHIHTMPASSILEFKPFLEEKIALHKNENSGFTILFLTRKPFNYALQTTFNDYPLEINYDEINSNDAIISRAVEMIEKKALLQKENLEQEFAELDDFVSSLQSTKLNAGNVQGKKISL